MRKWNGIGSPSTYIFWLACFCIGFVVVKALSLGLLRIDYSEGPGWSPLSRQPDGWWALSDFAVSVVGALAMVAVCVLVPVIRH